MTVAWDAFNSNLPVHFVVQLIPRSPAERFRSRKTLS